MVRFWPYAAALTNACLNLEHVKMAHNGLEVLWRFLSDRIVSVLFIMNDCVPGMHPRFFCMYCSLSQS